MSELSELDLFLLNKGNIFLSGDITEESSTLIVKQLLYLSENKSPFVKMFIHSDGGEIEGMYAIIDTMSSIKIPVYTIVKGKAYSAAGIIVLFGKKRFATANSCIMLHPLHYELGGDYNEQQKKVVDFYDKEYSRLLGIMSNKLNIKKNRLQNKIKDGLWMNTYDALKFGIIDKVWDSTI